MLNRVCLVTTLRNADAVLTSFVQYHLSAGFDHLFLFFDDNDDPGYCQWQGHKNVTVIRNGAALAQQWQATRSYGYHGAFTGREVMSRQVLNAEVAIDLARDLRMQWIVHLDVDELFYCPGRDVHEHFEELAYEGVEVANYWNHEGVPESFHICDYFREVHLFKRNIHTLTPQQKQIAESTPLSAGRYFNFYKIGKSAARLHDGLRPDGVHYFMPAGRMKRIADPCILHYPCCGFGHFLRKYETLGAFSDKWFDRDEIMQRLPVHVISRDVVQSGDAQLAEDFYRAVFLPQDREKLDYLLTRGVCFRIAPLAAIVPRPDRAVAGH